MGHLISILHPSRGRAVKSIETIEKWISRADIPFELIVSIDRDDPTAETYINEYSRRWLLNPNDTPCKKIIINENRSAVDAINNAARECTGQIMIVVSDDTDCPYHWDTKILEATRGREDFVLRANDEIQPWIVTMPVIDRVYYNRFGYVYYPEFLHMFCDTLITHQADALKKIIWRDDLRFPHNHYSIKKSVKDGVNEKADATWNHGKAMYLEMVRRNLDLPTSVNIYDLSHRANRHIEWIKANL